MSPALRYGLDIGATKIHAIALDESLEVQGELVCLTGHGTTAVTTAISDAVLGLRAQTDPSAVVTSVGVGIPGLVDRDRGVVEQAVNLGIASLDVTAVIRAAIDAPVAVDNDVNVAAIGAAHHLGADDRDVAFLNLGTGIAAGLSVRGRLWRGSRGTAGEIGHHPIPNNPLLCPCGQVGCLETIASGTGLARAWRGDDALPGTSLVRHATSGNSHAKTVLARFSEAVALAVQLLAVTWDPDIIAIGGGLLAMGPALESGVGSAILEREDRSPFVASLGLHSRVRFLDPDASIAPFGAALVGVRSLAV
jgi:predicted NBD/HSP70 family sugar kinase